MQATVEFKSIASMAVKLGLIEHGSIHSRGAVRTGATGAWAPVEIGQRVPGTRPVL